MRAVGQKSTTRLGLKLGYVVVIEILGGYIKLPVHLAFNIRRKFSWKKNSSGELKSEFKILIYFLNTSDEFFSSAVLFMKFLNF